MKLTEYENEDALDILAKLIEPASKIFGDKKVAEIFSKKKVNKMEIIKYVLSDYKPEIIEILAGLENKTADEYHGNLLTMTTKLLEIFNDKDLVDFFHSQGQMMA